MTVAHLLCDDGITAELFLGALLDAGADLDAARTAIEAAGVPSRLHVDRITARHVACTTVVVEDVGDLRLPTRADWDALVRDADVTDAARYRAQALIDAVITAEAQVHAVDPADVHLHELARPRTLARILAIAVAMESLDIGTVTTSPVAVGGGVIDIHHGRFPVPPPAVLHLLQGFDIRGDDRQVELTTPSGAAVLAAFATAAPSVPAITLGSHGRGAQRHPDGDRLLTLLLGAPSGSTSSQPTAPDAIATDRASASDRTGSEPRG